MGLSLENLTSKLRQERAGSLFWKGPHHSQWSLGFLIHIDILPPKKKKTKPKCFFRIKAKPYNRNPWYFRLKLDLFLWMDKETRPDIIILFFTWGTTHNRCYNFCCTNPYYLFTTYSGPEGLTRFLHEQSQSSLQPYAIKTPILLMSRVRLATIQ